ACDSQYYGFYNQIQNAARQFRRYATYPNDYNHVAGRNNSVRFNPQTVCGSSTVYIENTATASLYNYTPYQPNQAALNNLYGTGDACSAYGNRNFWRDFNNWFGVSFGDGFVLAISDDPGDQRQWVLYGTIKQYVPDSQTKIAWNLQDAQLVTMSAATLNGISTGPPLDRLARYNGGPIYFMDGGKRYKMPWDVLLDTWNLHGTTISSVSHGLFHQTADGGEMSFSIKDPSSSTVYMPEGPNGSGQTILRPFANATVQQAWEGTTRATEVSTDYWDRINDAIGPALTSTKITHGGTDYEVVGTYRLTLSGSTAPLYPSAAQPVSAVTVNRLIPAGNAPVLLRAAGNLTTYLIDGGTRHSVTNADVFAAWTAGSRVVEVNPSFMSLIPEGAPLTSYLAKTGSQATLLVAGKKMAIPAQLLTAYENAFPVYAASSTLMDNFSVGPAPTGFIKGAASPQVYLLDNSGKRRHLEWADKVTSWGGYRIGVITLPESVVNSIGTAGSPQTFVSNGTTNYVMDDGKKYAVPAATQTAWGLASPQVYGDGTLDRFEDGGNLQTGFRAGDGYYVVRDGVSHGTGDRAIAEAWAVEDSSRYSTGIFSLLRNYMLTRYVKSSVPGDDRIFLVDKGQWYNLPPAQQHNLRAGSQPKVIMNPSNAPNTITDLASPVVKNASNAAFVIDDGGKRYFPHPMIYDQWTNFGQITVPTMSSGLLDSLPNRGLIERAVKGVSEPMVYSVESGKKRHILYPDVFTRSYAPMVEVSDALVGTLPSGPSISQ
ncbi:MAG TPA: hypothetical protein VFT87_00945, partial [Candidatus Saccharimonadales bacterium]|nr:hypothetical protein [Candidatus Saccharimonadales bacterium]